MNGRKNEHRTRAFAGPQDWKCPVHKVNVARKVRFGTDARTGDRKFMGEYFGCPRYGECGYYVSPGDGTRPPMVAVV